MTNSPLPAGPWTGRDGRFPLPWLEEPWTRAVAQRGHALLLHGPEGVGQFELALALAQTWLCESAPLNAAAAHRPCGHCEACHQLQAGVHPDLMILVPEAQRERLGLVAASEEGGDASATPSGGKTKSGGREIRVADVRRAIDWAHQTSSRGRGKVLVIHPAQALNRVAANALLKTLEEPAGSLRLVLSTADAQALLPTVRSRCQQLPLHLPPADQAGAWLESQGVVDAETLLRACGGRAQEALAMAQDGLDARLWPEIPSLVRQGRAEALMGLPMPRVIDALQKTCLDLLSRAHRVPPEFFPSEALPAGAQSGLLAAWWRDLVKAARHADHPWNAGLLVESLVLQGRQCWPARAASGNSPRPSSAR